MKPFAVIPERGDRPAAGAGVPETLLFSGPRVAAAPQPAGPPRILWIDPDAGQEDAGAQMLRRHGFEIDRHDTVAAAESVLAEDRPDLLILETALGAEDALDFCRRQSEADGPPILAYSARADALDRVAGLEFGADDYLDKTAHPLELLARVRALLRRTGRARRRNPDPGPVWRFDTLSGCVSAISGRSVQLSPADAALLAVLAERPGQPLSREVLVKLLYGDAAQVGGRSVDARVSRLRRALAACDGAGELIRTLRGGGYMFLAAVQHPAPQAA